MRRRFSLALTSLLYIFLLLVSAQGAKAQSIDETRAKISSLEREIATFEGELNKTEAEKNTLANKIKTLDLTRKKLEAQTQVTQTKVGKTSTDIANIQSAIQVHTDKITQRVSGITDALRKLYELAGETPAEILLSNSSLSVKMDRAYSLQRLQNQVRIDMDNLKDERNQLSNDKNALEMTKSQLVALQGQLIDQHKLTVDSINSKSVLLTQTKNKESTYKTLLEQKIAEKAKVEAELRDYESKLKADVDLGNLPHGSGVLSWPLASVSITQYFGNTDFSRQNSAVYNGHGHNGIDLRASVGTAVMSAADGTVTGTGNTDLGCPGGSYGNWVLIDHGNGLSTLYGHLSLIKVGAGQKLNRGDLIGYSGNTGYSTGPHLHFTVYATEGVKITQLIHADGSASKCTPMPVSPLNGYLNPLLYL